MLIGCSRVSKSDRSQLVDLQNDTLLKQELALPIAVDVLPNK